MAANEKDNGSSTPANTNANNAAAATTSTVASPLIRLANLAIEQVLVSFKGEPDLLAAAHALISNVMLTSHEYDKRLQSKDARQFLARMYSTYCFMLMNKLGDLQQLDDSVRKEFLKPVFWILANLDYKDPFTVQMYQRPDFFRLLAFCADSIIANKDLPNQQQKQFAEYLINRASEFLKTATDLNQETLKTNIANIDVKNMSVTLSETLASLYDSPILDCAICIAVVLLQKVNEIKCEIPQLLVDVIMNFIDLLKTHFSTVSLSNYWRWLYGAVLCNFDLPLSVKVPNYDQLTKISQALQSELNVIHMEDIQPLEIPKDANDNIQLEGKDEQSEIRGATLEKLIERLTLVKDQVGKYLQIFFISYRSFCSPFELMTKLSMRFVKMKQLSDNSANANDKAATLRLLNAIKHWINDHFYDFDNALVVTMVHFIDKFVSGEYLRAAQPLKKRIEHALVYGIQSAQQNNVTMANVSSDKMPKPLIALNRKPFATIEEFLECPPLEVARQIALIEHAIFKQITPKECFKCAWSKQDKEKNSPSIVALSSRFNTLSGWVATHIVQQENTKKRANVLKFWIQVAEHSRELNNFNAMNCIVAGLNLAAIHRLNKTWAEIPKRHKQMFDQMCNLTSTAGSYKNMREALANMVPPVVPYIGIYLTDLTFLEDGNPDNLKVANENNSAEEIKLINFSKRRKIAGVIMNIRIYQSNIYNFLQIPALRDILAKMDNVMDEKELYEKSLKIEPRE